MQLSLLKVKQVKFSLNFNMNRDAQNIMVVLSSPSGVGKTTITKKIQQKYQSFKISVSHTTRLPRSNEVDGVDYHFISRLKFEELIKKE